MRYFVWAMLLVTSVVQAAPSDEELKALANSDVQNWLQQGKKAMANKQWQVALDFLLRAEQRAPDNADLHNYLGYAYRNNGQLPRAFEHYEKALRLNPGHIGAHEYIGEAYLMTKQPEKAEAHLAALAKYCQPGCEEYAELKEKIAAYRAQK